MGVLTSLAPHRPKLSLRYSLAWRVLDDLAGSCCRPAMREVFAFGSAGAAGGRSGTVERACFPM
jgi:hypothetical protein